MKKKPNSIAAWIHGVRERRAARQRHAEFLEEAQLIKDAVAQFPKSHPAYGSKTREEFIFDLSSRIETRIAFESGWISQRMSWLVISQSFLFNAFATASATNEPLRMMLRILIVGIAIIQAVAASASIHAAKAINREVAAMRGIVDATIRGMTLLGEKPMVLSEWPILGRTRGGPIRSTFRLGELASKYIPLTLVGAWVVLAIWLWRAHFTNGWPDMDSLRDPPLWLDWLGGVDWLHR